MAAQKFTKKGLKQDSFVDSTEKVLEFLQQNATAVGIAFLVVIVLLVGGSYVRKGRAAARAEASYMFYQGQIMVGQGDYALAITPLEDCIAEHGDTEFGKYARLALVQAQLGLGQTDEALALIDTYLGEISGKVPIHKDLLLLQAGALADAGRYAEAADVMGGLITDDLPDAVYYDRTVRRAEWLGDAGQRGAALALLEELEASADAGEIDVLKQDLDYRLGVARALDF